MLELFYKIAFKEFGVKKYNWVSSTKFKGVRYHQHESRKNGVSFDRLFGLRYQMEGKRYEHILGWSSEGWSEQKAGLELTRLKQDYKLGNGAVSLVEKRKQAREKREEEEKLRQEEEKRLITFSEYWNERYWISQQHKSKSSLVAEDGLYRKWIKPTIGTKPIVHLKAIDLEKIKHNILEAGRAPSTIKYIFAIISQVWTLARKDELTSSESPTKKVTLPTKDNRRERFLTLDESKILLTQLQGQSLQTHDMALMSLYCGLRFGEIASLEWQSIDFSNGSISIRDPKSKKNRMAYLTPQLVQMLNERKKVILEKGCTAKGLIFPSKHGTVMVSVSNTFTRVADTLFNQGIEDRRQKVCFHTLRHTFASWLVQKGVDLYSVKELMGHADFKMTQRYSHLSPDGLRKAARVLFEE